MSEPVKLSPSPYLNVDEEGIAQIRFNDPSRNANVLSEGVMRRLSQVIGEICEGIEAGKVKGVLIRSGKPASFIVGADIDAIAQVESPDQGALAARLGQTIYRELELLPVPTVAAIHGACMGGGTEMGLACRYRVASDHPKTRIGLPEVQLGILPAWGGTTRLPRLIGLQGALDLILTGKKLDGNRARKAGLVEAVFPHPIFEEAALDFLRKRIADGPIPTGASSPLPIRLLEATPPGRRIILSMARKKVMAQTGGNYPAPLRILEVIGASAGRSLERGFELEAEAAGELLASGVSKNLVHIFHLQEASKKGTGLPAGAEPRKVDRLGVVGAGVMGGGVAQLAANHGIQVRVKDIRHEAVGQALEHAQGLFRKRVERRRMSEREAEQAMERISGGIDYSGFGSLDLVVEAVVEKMEVKRAVLAEVEGKTSPGCILTTNTSTLSVDAMAEALARPENFAGMHFFNPVDRMPLVEVIAGARTSPEAVATVHALCLRMGKVPVVVRDGPGFLVNRILGPYLNEAGHLLAEGASIEVIDRAATRFGLPMGPLRLIDEIGIDVMRHAGEVLHQAFGQRLEPAAPLVRLGDTKRLGKKGGSGFYRYEGGKEQGVDPTVYGEMGLSIPEDEGPISIDDVRARLILAMINEAARVLEDGIAASAGDVDLAMIMGTGFPPFRGGLLRFADDQHPRTLVKRMEGLAVTLSGRFQPAPLLKTLAAEDREFYQAFPDPGK